MKGQINAALQAVVADCPPGATHAVIDLRGTWSGTLALQQTLNGTDWVTIPASSILRNSTLDQTNGLVSASTDTYTACIAGALQIRVYSTAWASGLVDVVLLGSRSNVVALSSGEAHVGEVSTRVAAPSANFTRPSDTTAYASGDLVANSTTAGSVSPLSWTAARVSAGTFFINRARLKKSTTSITSAQFRLHLYTSSPTCANGDNGAWSTTHSGYLGSLDITCDKAFTDAAGGEGIPATGSQIEVALTSGQTIYGLLEARAAYTPGNAEVFTVILELIQN